MTVTPPTICPAKSEPPGEDSDETTVHSCDLPAGHADMHLCHCGVRFMRETQSGWQR